MFDMLFPIVTLLLLFGVTTCTYIYLLPKNNPHEQALADTKLASSETLSSLQKSTFDIQRASQILQVESLKEEYFFSPKHVSGTNIRRGKNAVRRMIYSYACMAPNDLAACFSTAFLADPSGAILGGVDLISAAKREAAILQTFDSRKSAECQQLAERQQLIVAGAISALSGRDDLIDGLLSSQDGTKILTLAVANGCRDILKLPEIQRYLTYLWTGELQGKRLEWAEEKELFEQLAAKQSAEMQDGLSPASTARAEREKAESAADAAEAIEMHRTAVRQFDRDGDGNVTFKEATMYLFRTLSESILLQWSLAIIAMPLVAICPPLELWGRRATADQILQRSFNTPPAVRFWLYEMSNIALAVFVSVSPLPVHLQAPDRIRDWTLVFWSAASFAKEIEFILARGVKEFVTDAHSIIGLLASVATCAALLLNVCNATDWFLYEGDGQPPEHLLFPAGDFRSIGSVWSRCDEIIPPLAARETLAVAMFLRWLNSLPRLAERSMFFGPLILTVRYMVVDTIKFLVLLIWVVLAWAVFFYMLYSEPFGSSTNPNCDVDPDTWFEDFGSSVTFLWEAMLEGSGYFPCFTASSGGYLATFFMYGFVLTSTIMLVNMLVAMMAESFSQVHGNRLEFYLFLRARQVVSWRAYAPVPPPLNLLRAPYELLWLPYELLRRCCPGFLPRISTREPGPVRFAGEPSFVLPGYWKAAHSAEVLTELVIQYVRGDTEGEDAEIIKSIADDAAKMTAQQTAELSDKMDKDRAMDRAAIKEDIANLKAEIFANIKAEVPKMVAQEIAAQRAPYGEATFVRRASSNASLQARPVSIQSARKVASMSSDVFDAVYSRGSDEAETFPLSPSPESGTSGDGGLQIEPADGKDPSQHKTSNTMAVVSTSRSVLPRQKGKSHRNLLGHGADGVGSEPSSSRGRVRASRKRVPTASDELAFTSTAAEPHVREKSGQPVLQRSASAEPHVREKSGQPVLQRSSSSASDFL